jgi:N-methylhydantoinase A
MKRVAIDVGGTFTDCLVMDESGELQAFKAPSSPPDYTVGFFHSLEKAARHYGTSLSEFLATVTVIVHGTTIATNAILTENGARTAMITTKNFRDIYELRRGFKRSSIYNVFVPPYRPLVPRYLRVGVTERTLYTGEILEPLDQADVRAALEQFARDGVESVAICFLHSYANPHNERVALGTCAEFSDALHVVASHDVLPVWREYERFSTTVLSAYVGPIVERYLLGLERRLRELAFTGALLIVSSSSLTQTVEHCRKRAVHLIGSGPAAAPTAGVYLARETEHASFLSFDVGGTSTDVTVVRSGRIPTTTEGWIGDERIAVKMVDVYSFGAGGGSIAWTDGLGVLRVGPASAGANPGPACYGQGGQQPTVTDADLLLGYLSPDYFLGGEMPLHEAHARTAIATLGRQLGLEIEQAAEAVFTVANDVMAREINMVTTRRGYDVRDFALIAGGGGGPVHAMWLAAELGIGTVIVPRFAALYSAFGMHTMEIGWEHSRSFVAGADRIDIGALNGLYAEMERQGVENLGWLGVSPADVTLSRSADMRYDGQFYEVEVNVAGGGLTRRDIDAAVEAFHRQHEALHAFAMPGQNVEFVTFHLRVSIAQPELRMPAIGRGSADPAPALKRRRRCRFAGRWQDTPVYEGRKLAEGNVVVGPAIIEEPTTTVVVPERFQCVTSRLGYLGTATS